MTGTNRDHTPAPRVLRAASLATHRPWPDGRPRLGPAAIRCLRAFLVAILVLALLAGCAQTEPARSPEGQVFLRAGADRAGSTSAEIAGGPALGHLGVLTPALDSEWQAAWIEGERKGGGAEGATSGFITGMAILQSVPIMFLTWPVAVGVMAGTTALGALGQHIDSRPLSRVSDEDRAALLVASANLHPDRLLREAVTKGLIPRTAQPPIPILWYPNRGPDTPGTDPLVDARRQGADGLLEIATETFGLAGGEDEATFGVFLRVRAQVVDVAGSRLRYQRVFEYGPGRRLPGVPPAASYSIEFLALDQARVFRQEVREAIERIARAVAEDPDLPVAAR